MKYYFGSIHKSDLEGMYSSKATILKYLKERCRNYLKPIKRKLASELGFSVEPYWVSSQTFGAVLCDFEPSKTGPSLIGAHKALFELISDGFDFFVLSENLDRNLQVYDIEDKKILVVNVHRYKKFISTFADKFRRIKLFLFRKLTPEEEEIINNWIDSKPTNIKKEGISTEEVINILSKESPDKISESINRLEFIKEKKIISKADHYEKELSDFESMVNDSKLSEPQLRAELFKRLWIIDFKYNSNQFKKAQEYHTEVGNVDLWISKNQLGKIKNVLIELKLPDKSLTVKYRNKEAVRSEIGKALSQLIHYLESSKKPYQIQNGLMIIGRESEEPFIEIFNEYLHGIKIKTYKQIIDECRAVINNFKLDDNTNSVKLSVEQNSKNLENQPINEVITK